MAGAGEQRKMEMAERETEFGTYLSTLYDRKARTPISPPPPKRERVQGCCLFVRFDACLGRAKPTEKSGNLADFLAPCAGLLEEKPLRSRRGLSETQAILQRSRNRFLGAAAKEKGDLGQFSVLPELVAAQRRRQKKRKKKSVQSASSSLIPFSVFFGLHSCSPLDRVLMRTRNGGLRHTCRHRIPAIASAALSVLLVLLSGVVMSDHE